MKKYLGSVVPQRDNYFACLNSAVFSDGTFVYVPEGVRCPMELSTYFRINAENTGQFERTLIVADKGATSATSKAAPRRCATRTSSTPPWSKSGRARRCRDEIFDRTELVSGRCRGQGRHLQLRHQARAVPAADRKVSWTQVETGSAITWKYPSCMLAGEGSVGEFYSVAVTNNRQQADTGTKMIHIGTNSRSTIVSKGISAGRSNNTYRGLVRVLAAAEGVRNFTQCDSLLLGDDAARTPCPISR